MGNYPRFFGKDASNLPTWDDDIRTEIERIRKEVEQTSVDLRFVLMLLREGYRDR